MRLKQQLLVSFSFPLMPHCLCDASRIMCCKSLKFLIDVPQSTAYTLNTVKSEDRMNEASIERADLHVPLNQSATLP